jgi:dTMP kinase
MMQSQEKDDFVRIDAGASIEEVQRKIREQVEQTISRVQSEQLPLRFVET